MNLVIRHIAYIRFVKILSQSIPVNSMKPNQNLKIWNSVKNCWTTMKISNMKTYQNDKWIGLEDVLEECLSEFS